MTAKTQAQALAVWQNFQKLLDVTLLELDAFAIVERDLRAAIQAGPQNPEETGQLDAIAQLVTAQDDRLKAVVETCRLAAATLGRFAGSTNVLNLVRNLDSFMDYMRTGTQAIVSRGFTKFSTWTPNGGNTGNGTFMVRNNLPTANDGDVGHAEVLTMRCTVGPADGAPAKFELRGEPADRRVGREAGSNEGQGYTFEQGGELAGLGRIHATSDGSLNTGVAFDEVGDDPASGNIAVDGGFLQSLGTDWTAVTGAPALETSAPIRGASSLSLPSGTAGAAPVVRQLIGSRVNPGGLYAIEAWVKKIGSPTGALTIKIKDGGSDYATITVADIATISTSPEKLAYATCQIPRTAAFSTLQVEIARSTEGGTGSIVVDLVRVPVLRVFEGRAVAKTEGLVATAEGDRATGATTLVEAGKLARFANLVWSRGFRHAGSATGWPDAVLAPVVDVLEADDDDEIALGTVANAAQTTDLTILNDGPFPLVIQPGDVTFDNATNLDAGPAVDSAPALVTMPGQTTTLTVAFEPDSDGGFSFDVEIASNDTGSPKVITVSGTAAT